MIAALARQTARNALGIVSPILLAVGLWMLSGPPGYAFWYDGRFTDLGAKTIVPAIILAVFAALWVIAPHLEALYGEDVEQ